MRKKSVQSVSPQCAVPTALAHVVNGKQRLLAEEKVAQADCTCQRLELIVWDISGITLVTTKDCQTR